MNVIKKFKDDNNLKIEYLENLKLRLTMSSLELEGENGNLASAKQALRIMGQLEALEYAFKNDEVIYNKWDFFKELVDINKFVTNGEVNNFRTTHAEVMGSNVRRSDPRNIRNDLLYLVDDHNFQMDLYKKNKNVDDLFLYEAQFHIRLLHIHPFDDGNGRTARVILAKHLFFNNFAPAVVTKETKREYCEYIENNDIIGLKEFLKALSKEEEKNMNVIYENIINSKKLQLKK